MYLDEFYFSIDLHTFLLKLCKKICMKSNVLLTFYWAVMHIDMYYFDIFIIYVILYFKNNHNFFDTICK